jgi:hypothetical protein
MLIEVGGPGNDTTTEAFSGARMTSGYWFPGDRIDFCARYPPSGEQRYFSSGSVGISISLALAFWSKTSFVAALVKISSRLAGDIH